MSYSRLDKSFLSDFAAPSYVEAPFIPSKVHKAKILLIKVPKFVAEIWEEAEHKNVVGVMMSNKETGQMESMTISDPSKKKGVAFLNAKIKNNSNLYVIQPRSKNRQHADICANVEKLIAFVPKFDFEYHEMLRKRHQQHTICRGRATTEETRLEDFDTNRTLFQYYNPRNRDGCNNLMNFDGGMTAIFDAPFSHRTTKSKQKKVVTMTIDALRLKIFNLFERSGEEGLTLKRLAVEVDQPLNFVKHVLEEVGEQRRRLSDRRLVYFLKDHYGTSEISEDPQVTKKVRLL